MKADEISGTLELHPDLVCDACGAAIAGEPLHYCGRVNCEYLLPELRKGCMCSVETPLAGLRIGQQKRRLAALTTALG